MCNPAISVYDEAKEVFLSKSRKLQSGGLSDLFDEAVRPAIARVRSLDRIDSDDLMNSISDEELALYGKGEPKTIEELEISILRAEVKRLRSYISRDKARLPALHEPFTKENINEPDRAQ